MLRNKNKQETEQKVNLYSLPINQIKPSGWLKEQMNNYVNNFISGVNAGWDKINGNSFWLGGKGEDSIFATDYMCGIVKLAFQLDNEVLKQKSKLWVDGILATADANGNFGNPSNTDWGVRISALKVLTAYFDVVEDKRIPDFAIKFFKYQFNEIDLLPPTISTMATLNDEIALLNYYYAITDKEFLLEVKQKLFRFGYDWKEHFTALPYKDETKKYLSKSQIFFKSKEVNKQVVKEDLSATQKIVDGNKDKNVQKYILSLGTVVAKNLTALYEMARYINEAGVAELTKNYIQELYNNHGLINGCFSADNHLNGCQPDTATDTATAIYTLEGMLGLERLSADTFYTEFADKIFYNVIFSVFRDNYKLLQGISSPNQIELGGVEYYTENSKNNYYSTNNGDILLASTSKAFCEFVNGLVYETDNGFAFYHYAPCVINANFEGNTISIEETTNYPFNGEVVYKFKEIAKPQELYLRFAVPKNTSMEIFVNGNLVTKGSGGVVVIKKQFVKNDEVKIVINRPLKAVFNVDGSLSFMMAGLLLVNPLNAGLSLDKKKGYGSVCMEDYRKAPIIKDKQLEIKSVKTNNNLSNLFDMDNPIIKVSLKADVVTNWAKDVMVYENIPKNAKFADSSDIITLIPYFASNCRISQFPYKVLETKK